MTGSFTPANIDHLLEIEHEDEREQVSLDDLSTILHGNSGNIERHINEEMKRLTVEALKVRDEYINTAKILQEEIGKSWLKFGVRVRLRKSVTMEWYRRHKVKNPTPGGPKVLSKYIKRSYKHRYHSKCFKAAAEWEYDIIVETENQLCQIRKKVDALTKLRQSLNEYRKEALKVAA